MWPVYLFNLVVALLIAGWYLRAVRRLEQRIDERMRKFDEWADAEDAKYDVARDEIRESMRSQIDEAIAEMRLDAERMEAEADRIRGELTANGIQIPDSRADANGDAAYPPLSRSLPERG